MDISCPHWIEEEFKSINFCDLRLVKRFKTIIKQLMVNNLEKRDELVYDLT